MILSKGFVIIRIKTMTDRVSLASRQNARTILIEKLSSISMNFPGKTERYIEVEI